MTVRQLLIGLGIAIVAVMLAVAGSVGQPAARRQASDVSYAQGAGIGSATSDDARRALGPPLATHWDSIGGRRLFELTYPHCSLFYRATDATLVRVEC